MYCKQCGEQMDDNAKYCSQCGTKNVSKEDDIESQEENREEDAAKQNEIVSRGNGWLGCGCFVAILVVIAIAATLFTEVRDGVFNGKSTANVVNQVISRQATNGDINIDDNLDIGSLSMDIIILPNSNIDDLEITIKYLDENRNLLKTDVKRVGDVKAGVQITKKISLTEFSFKEILKISYYEIKVSGGTVSYFQK